MNRELLAEREVTLWTAAERDNAEVDLVLLLDHKNPSCQSTSAPCRMHALIKILEDMLLFLGVNKEFHPFIHESHGTNFPSTIFISAN